MLSASHANNNHAPADDARSPSRRTRDTLSVSSERAGMSTIDDLLAQIPMDQLARQLGVTPGEAEKLTRQALPALVGGMEANAHDPRGATSLMRAIGKHDNDLLDGGVDLDQVDTDDGYKIVLNVFGNNSDKVINRLGSGKQDSMMSKLLPMLAPIVMAYLAKRMTGGPKSSTKSGTKAKAGADDALPGGLGELLGGLLGGGSGGSGGGGGLGDLLGGLLGGGKR
jgi:hypothetical protein